MGVVLRSSRAICRLSLTAAAMTRNASLTAYPHISSTRASPSINAKVGARRSAVQHFVSLPQCRLWATSEVTTWRQDAIVAGSLRASACSHLLS